MSCECGKNVTCQCGPPSLIDCNILEGCTPSFNGCQCRCHSTPNVRHFVACCFSGDTFFAPEVYNVQDGKDDEP